MFHYYHIHDGFFDHLYRIQTHQPINGQRYEALHLNTTSLCINENTVVLSEDMKEVSEKEFNETLNNALTNLGINLKRFTFV
jgi:hypothetical protein